MRCKKGDLAFVVGGPSDGIVVRCVEYYGGPWSDLVSADGWLLDRPILKSNGNRETRIADRSLRPIRPGDLEDETPTEIIKEQTCEHQ